MFDEWMIEHEGIVLPAMAFKEEEKRRGGGCYI